MLRVRQIKIPIKLDNGDSIKKEVASRLRINVDDIDSYKIIKKSIDARDKDNILYVYEVDVTSSLEESILRKNKNKDIFVTPVEEYKVEITGNKMLDNRIVIVGSGPAGIFCAYMLADKGYKPLIIERGEKIEDRVKRVLEFFNSGKLNINSNIQFGEGGAGTFSDGKLNTLVKDKFNRGKKVFEIFVENGAPHEIMYLNKPHIGTDILRDVVKNMRNKIISLGGEFLYNTCLTDLIIKNGCITGIEVNDKEIIPCGLLVLAIGHSARDTFYVLNRNKINMKAKNFAVGLRIEHPREMIDKSQYGKFYKLLPPASYKLTHKCSNGRGVYTFCMCPGGYVVNASSEEGCLVVNGMSNYKRDGKNSNSAVVVTITKEDFGNDIFSGIEFQRKLEKCAYTLGKGKIPIQLVGDFIENKESTMLGNITPNTLGEYSFSDLNRLFSKEINESLKEGIASFDKKIKGFGRYDAILLGVESRTSSPVIIERDDKGESNIKGLYPCGEGSGYAGGITTAAIDGIKVAENIFKEYKV